MSFIHGVSQGGEDFEAFIGNGHGVLYHGDEVVPILFDGKTSPTFLSPSTGA
ncbi:MAG: hypothetical protein R2788_09450 [Saprospiraceae bacterium]